MSVQIGYELLADRSGVTVTSGSAADTNVVENASDWLPFDYWQVDADTTTPFIQYAAASTELCDYAAFMGHDLVASTDQWKIQHSPDGTTWTDAFAWEDVISGVNFKSWTAAEHLYWRIIFQRDSGATAFSPIVSCVGLGNVFDTAKNPQAGFTPPQSHAMKSTTSISVDGTFLGRSITDVATDGKITFNNMTAGWVRGSWMPFHEHAKEKPFFLSWDETNYPEDAAFCWVDKDIKLPTYSDVSWMKAEISFKAVP